MEGRKVPERSCVGCREKKAKSELIRIVRAPSGQVSLDESGRSPGRGAYLCPQTACLEKAIKKGGLAKSLHTSLSPEQLEAIRKEFAFYEKGDA